MVHQKTRSTKSSFNKDVSPVRGYASHKIDIVQTPVKVSPPVDKWKYTNMIKDNRQAFNDLHFC